MPRCQKDEQCDGEAADRPGHRAARRASRIGTRRCLGTLDDTDDLHGTRAIELRSLELQSEVAVGPALLEHVGIAPTELERHGRAWKVGAIRGEESREPVLRDEELAPRIGDGLREESDLRLGAIIGHATVRRHHFREHPLGDGSSEGGIDRTHTHGEDVRQGVVIDLELADFYGLPAGPAASSLRVAAGPAGSP